MSEIKLSESQRSSMLSKLDNYFSQEIDHELGQFELEFLLDFILKELGGAVYNQALSDAQIALQLRVEDTLVELEKLSSL